MKNKNTKLNTPRLLITVFILLFFIFDLAEATDSALFIAPSQGTFFVGSTFDLSIFLDTKENRINAIEVNLKFPQDILQISTPTTGKSLISEWLTPPTYSNIDGTVSFKGGIPEGITTSSGLVSTITFRARSPGQAKIEILGSSKILLADGKGTPISSTNAGGEYQIITPPPEGPVISSSSHPDSDKWYPNSSAIFSWEKEEGISEFSFSFSQNPQENPDTVSEGDQTSKSYDDIPDGIWYFHLRARKGELWGKTSHFAIRIDNSPPQKFDPQVDTNSGFIYFETKDSYSGIAYYEASVLNITENPKAIPFLIETTSPFKIPNKQTGEYNVIVKAYDKAGNYQTAEAQFQIMSPIASYVKGKGIEIKGVFFSLTLLYFVLFIFIIGLVFLIIYFLRRKSGFKRGIKEIKEALKEIEKIEERERKIGMLKEKFEQEKEKLEERLQ